jgi:hypothetical protein
VDNLFAEKCGAEKWVQYLWMCLKYFIKALKISYLLLWFRMSFSLGRIE